MNVKKFSANTSREALRMVRDALGADAVILSNRNVNGGVEILALAGEDMSSLAEPAVEKAALSESTLAALSPKRKQDSGQKVNSSDFRQTEEQAGFLPNRRQEGDQAASLAQALESARAASTEKVGSSTELAEVMDEIRSMRGMLEAQLAELSWGSQQKREPAKSAVLREMLASGFSPSLARYITEKIACQQNT